MCHQACIQQSHYSQSKFWVQDFTKTCGWTTNTKWLFFYEVHLWCKQRYHPPCSIRTFLMVTRLHIPAWFLFLWHNSSPQISHNLFFSCTLSESLPWLSFFFENKKRKNESFIDWIFQWLSVYRDLYSSSSSWLAAGNSHKEEPSWVLETRCHPDETTMQQHIFDDVVTLCSKNGKKSRKQRILQCFPWYNTNNYYCSYANITELLSHLMKISCFLIGRQGAHYGTI